MINMFLLLVIVSNLPHFSFGVINNLGETQCETRMLDFIRVYFRDRHCLTLIEITTIRNYSINIYYQKIDILRKVLKIKPNDFDAKIKIRPRRDDINPDGIIRNFCLDSSTGYLIFSPSLDLFRNYSFGSKISPLLDPLGKFVVVLEESHVDIEGFYKEMWPIFKVPNLLFIDKNCQLYFYNRFIKYREKWGKLFSYKIEEVRQDIETVTNDMRSLNEYPIKTIQFFSLMAYQLFENATYADYGGMDGEFLTLLSQIMNFTKVILPKQPKGNYGEKTTNGTFKGALKNLLDGDVEFVSVSYFLKDYLTRDIEFSTTAMQDDLCCVVHKSGKIPIWEIFYVYYEVWAMLICSFFVIGSIWTLIQKFEALIEGKATYSDFIFLDTLRLMIVNSFPRLPKIASERIFLVFTMMAFVTFLGAFQGSLMTILSKPSFYPDTTTLEQLASTNYPILTRFEAIKNDMFGDDPKNPINAKLRQMVKMNTNNLSADALIARDGNVAGIVRRSSNDLEIKTRYYDELGSDVIHLVEECPRDYALAYILPRNSAFGPRMNDLILRIAQSGLFFKWYRAQAWNTTLTTRQARLAHIEVVDDLNDIKSFTVDDLVFAFYILLVGFSTSVFMFFVELVYKKCRIG